MVLAVSAAKITKPKRTIMFEYLFDNMTQGIDRNNPDNFLLLINIENLIKKEMHG